MMKRTICIIILLLIIPSLAFSEGGISDLIINEQMDFFNTRELEELVDEVLNDNKLPKLSLREGMKKLLKGEKLIDGKSITKILTDNF